ncbi:MAG: restriction endonuclease subunit S [Syntrophales bacterium]
MSWLANSPFPAKRLKYIVMLRRARFDGPNDDMKYLGLESIESWTGKLINASTANDGEASLPLLDGISMGNTFESGDVLFGKLRPYLAKAWVADVPGRSTTELLVMQPVHADSRFLLYVCLWRDFIDTVDASTFGAKMPRADWDFIGNIPIPVPSIPQQRAIANYLDRETARIDALIAAKERLLELLAEKRRALITRAVTRGLDPDVPLRDLGIPWLGEIPAHWKIRRIAWLFRERDHRGEPELPLLVVSINFGVILREFSDERIESTAADFNTYKIARRGDVVFNKMRMWQGAVGVAPVDGLVSPDYVVAEPTGALLPEYAELLFHTQAFSAECARHSHGIVWDRLRLYWDGFRDITVPLPSVSEQTEIVNRVLLEASKIKWLGDATEKTIILLKERRAALIAAAVTGQIDVGGDP